MIYKKESPSSAGQGNTYKRLYEGTTHPSQLQTIFQYFYEHVATASMVSADTGVPKNCITRYKRDLEKLGFLWEIEKKTCMETGNKAWYLTTNILLVPKMPNQLLTDQEQCLHPIPKEQHGNLRCQCCGASDVQLQVYNLYHNPCCNSEIEEEAIVAVCDSCSAILHKELPKLSAIIAFKLLSGQLDPLDPSSMSKFFQNEPRLNLITLGKEIITFSQSNML
jgi:hypothetical protein